MANLIREKFAFYFGSTSTAPQTKFFFNFLKEQGYRIRLLHISAPDSVRWESIRERDQDFLQATEEDVKEKGKLLPQRISDTYLAYADRIEFYCHNVIKEDAQLAAIWIRNEGNEIKGTLQVLNPPLYEKIKEIHNASLQDSQKAELSWEATVENHSIISQ